MPWPGGLTNRRIHIVATGRRVGSTQPHQGSTALGCTASATGSGPVTATANYGTYPDGQFGLHTFGASAWFDYIFYVEAAPK